MGPYQRVLGSCLILFILIGMSCATADVPYVDEACSDRSVEIAVIVEGNREFSACLKSQADIHKFQSIFNDFLQSLRITTEEDDYCTMFFDILDFLSDHCWISEDERARVENTLSVRYSSLRSSVFFKLFKKSVLVQDSNRNVCCLTAGNVTRAYVWRPDVTMYRLFNQQITNEFLQMMLLLYVLLVAFPLSYVPIQLCGTLLVGELITYWNSLKTFRPGIGTIWSQGLFGKKIWENELYGSIGLLPPMKFFNGQGTSQPFLGGIGFSGVTIKVDGQTYFLGSMLLLHIG